MKEKLSKRRKSLENISDDESMSTFGSVYSYKDAILSTSDDASGASVVKVATKQSQQVFSLKLSSSSNDQLPSLFKVKSTLTNLGLNIR